MRLKFVLGIGNLGQRHHPGVARRHRAVPVKGVTMRWIVLPRAGRFLGARLDEPLEGRRIINTPCGRASSLSKHRRFRPVCQCRLEEVCRQAMIPLEIARADSCWRIVASAISAKEHAIVEMQAAFPEPSSIE